MLRKILYRGIHFIKFGFSFFRPGEPYVSDKTILLINGDPDFCHLHGDELAKQGFKSIFAFTLESAQLQLNSYNPDIILLDHKLPDGPGIEFLKQNESVLEQKQVIFMTADASTASKVTAMKSGIFNILPKPFQPAALNKMIYLAAHFS